MKKFDIVIYIVTIIVAVASIAHIEFPFRKHLLYLSAGYVLIIDLFIPMLRRKR